MNKKHKGLEKFYSQSQLTQLRKSKSNNNSNNNKSNVKERRTLEGSQKVERERNRQQAVFSKEFKV